MRKTRLVILPTKCLHQMGFLLLFLSCPVIGDWGRIRPESEDSHDAIQIDREGSCGWERDPPGGLLGFLNEDGSEQCRLSENHDSNKVIERVVNTRSDVRRVYTRIFDQRMSERRMTDERNFRKVIQRKADERRDSERDFQTSARRNVRSIESRWSSIDGNDARVRSPNLRENERAIREQKSAARNIRRHNERNTRKDWFKRVNERQNEERVDRQRRLNRELINERRETERVTRAAASERREIKRFSQSAEHERQEVRRESSKKSFQKVNTKRRENDTRRQNQRVTERRLSFARRELDDTRRIDIMENRRSASREYAPEIQKTRNVEFTKNKSERREMNRFDNRRVIVNRRSVSLPPKLSERNVREHRIDTLSERMERKSRRIIPAAVRQNPEELPKLKLENKNSEDKEFFGGITKWMDLKTYEDAKTENWTTNCVIGAVVYFLTTKQAGAGAPMKAKLRPKKTHSNVR